MTAATAAAAPFGPIPLSCIRCGCGSGEVFALRPGSEPVVANGRFSSHSEAEILLLARGEPSEAWCVACWRRRFGARDAG